MEYNSSMIKKPYGILFDMGETILFQKKYLPIKGIQAILDALKYQGHLTSKDILDIYNKIIFGFVSRVRDESTLELNFQSFLRFLFEYVGINIDSIPLNELELIYCKSTLEYVLVEGVLELLSLMDELEIKKGILSNCWYSGNILRYDLECHSIQNQFDFVISSTDYCFRKPNTLIFDLAVRKLGSKHKDIWYMGDRFKYDVIGASNAGLFPVWFNHHRKSKLSDIDYLEIEKISELTNLLRRL